MDFIAMQVCGKWLVRMLLVMSFYPFDNSSFRVIDFILVLCCNHTLTLCYQLSCCLYKNSALIYVLGCCWFLSMQCVGLRDFRDVVESWAKFEKFRIVLRLARSFILSLELLIKNFTTVYTLIPHYQDV